MSRKDIMPPSASAAAPRPKIHRLPPAASHSPEKHPYTANSSGLWRWGAFLFVLGLVWTVGQKQATAYFKHDTLKLAALAPVENIQPESILQPLSDAQAAALPERPATIMLRGSSETIIGQMAKIPAENEQITEIKAVSEVDNNAGRELLSIISKY